MITCSKLHRYSTQKILNEGTEVQIYYNSRNKLSSVLTLQKFNENSTVIGFAVVNLILQENINCRDKWTQHTLWIFRAFTLGLLLYAQTHKTLSKKVLSKTDPSNRYRFKKSRACKAFWWTSLID